MHLWDETVHTSGVWHWKSTVNVCVTPTRATIVPMAPINRRCSLMIKSWKSSRTMDSWELQIDMTYKACDVYADFDVLENIRKKLQVLIQLTLTFWNLFICVWDSNAKSLPRPLFAAYETPTPEPRENSWERVKGWVWSYLDWADYSPVLIRQTCHQGWRLW